MRFRRTMSTRSWVRLIGAFRQLLSKCFQRRTFQTISLRRPSKGASIRSSLHPSSMSDAPSCSHRGYRRARSLHHGAHRSPVACPRPRPLGRCWTNASAGSSRRQGIPLQPQSILREDPPPHGPLVLLRKRHSGGGLRQNISLQI